MSNQLVPFIEFSKSDYTLDAPDQAILGFAVCDPDGEHVGHVEELLLDNSAAARRDAPDRRRVSLAVVNTGGLLGHQRIMVLFEVFRDMDQTRREVKVTYHKEDFEQDDAAFRGLDFLDQGATGRLYGLYDMEHHGFDERAGADPEGSKYG